MLPDRVSNPGPLTYESGALPITLHGPASKMDLDVWDYFGREKFLSYNQGIDRWMVALLSNIIFNSISVISGQWDGDNERLCAEEPHLQLKMFLLPRIKLGTA